MKVSKRQLLRIIREEAEAAAEEEAVEGAEEGAEEEADAVDEARLRRKIRSALMNESRGAGLFGGIGFHGLGQTSTANHAKAYHGTYATTKQQRVIKPSSRKRVVKEQAGGDAKNVLYKTVIPALEDAGFKGIEAFKMLRRVTQIMEDDLRAMLGPRE